MKLKNQSPLTHSMSSQTCASCACKIVVCMFGFEKYMFTLFREWGKCMFPVHLIFYMSC